MDPCHHGGPRRLILNAKAANPVPSAAGFAGRALRRAAHLAQQWFIPIARRGPRRGVAACEALAQILRDDAFPAKPCIGLKTHWCCDRQPECCRLYTIPTCNRHRAETKIRSVKNPRPSDEAMTRFWRSISKTRVLRRAHRFIHPQAADDGSRLRFPIKNWRP